MPRQVGISVLGQCQGCRLQVYLGEIEKMQGSFSDVCRGRNMNFEGQNINLQDALFVDNITGKKKYNKIQRSLIFCFWARTCWHERCLDSNSESCNETFLYIYFFIGLVCWPSLCLSRPFMIFEGCLSSNSECCRSKRARYQLSHPSP